MKLIKNVINLVLISLFISSCNNDDLPITNEKNDSNKSLMRNTSQLTAKKNYSSNTLVVKYASWVTNANKIFIRNYFGVIKYELCSHCDDDSIELWMFDSNINIEPKKETISNPPITVGYPTNPSGKAIQYVEYNYEMQLGGTKQSLKSNTSISLTSDYSSYIKNSNDGVTIAVFDTGIKPSLGSSAFFPDKFLYNASADGIPGVYSGWDFVNNDHNPADDDPNLHGSAVTSIITRILNNYHMNYQILPLKISDSNGKISYFNLVCSLNFALERKATVLQMSLGWYGYLENPNDNIFVNLANHYPNTVIVCSAGNDNNNNDQNFHYPSGYPLNNIFSIGSCNATATNISSWSNYGLTTVDFFAKGEGTNFLGTSLMGTSFAAPIVSAKIARIKSTLPNISSMSLEDLLLSISPTANSFDPNKPIKHNTIINP